MSEALGSDAWALWQDTIDLLAGRGLPESVLAMLRSCTPRSLENGTLTLSTKMRLVQRKLTSYQPDIDASLTEAAFEPTTARFELDLAPEAPRASAGAEPPRPAPDDDSPSSPKGDREDQREAEGPTDGSYWESVRGFAAEDARERSRRRKDGNPLVETISANDSRLTFERFVQGDENIIAYQAALQVAEGENKSYNPLFIYGKSGLGKTHLLRAIQNYIERNDPYRICVYKESTAFIDDYVQAMKDRETGAGEALKRNYRDIDVLIIDDIQNMANAGRTIDFFFDLFNYLTTNGKQVVIAADRSPAQLGMGKNHFDERVTSRIDSGVSTSISVPSYELKVRLVNTFVERLVEDARREGAPEGTATISPETQKLMAEQAGTNIRVIEGFCQSCLIQEERLERKGSSLGREDVERIARERWPLNKKTVTIEQIQRAVEGYYDIDHADLIGNKRTKELMEPRHVCVWLSRELTDSTLADIGKRFGGRTHATVKHSISWVEENRKKDKNLYERIEHVREIVLENS